MRYALLLMLVLGSASGVQAQDNDSNVKTFMRAKLVHAQKVLEGITTDNLDEAAKNSQELSLLSLASTWQVLETPEYTRRSNEFRRAVDDLTKAAKAGNLDGATLGYVNVTLKCVECHKYVRSVRQARVAPSADEQFVRNVSP